MRKLRCPIHDLAHPANVECPVCLGEQLREAESTKTLAGRWVVRSGFVVGALLVVGGATWGVANVGGAAHEQRVAETRFDPEHFRVQIEEVRVLLGSGAADHETSEALVRAAEFLGNLLDVVRATPPQFAPSARLASFREAARRLDPSAPNAATLEEVREEWINARDALFQPADWFEGPDRAGDAAGRPDPDAAARGPGAEWERRTLGDLVDLMEMAVKTGRSRAMDVDEPVAPSRTLDALRQEREWESVALGVRSSLNDVTGVIPTDGELTRQGRNVAQQLRRAAYEVERLMRGGNVPTRATRESAFRQADRYLARTRSEFAKLGV